MVKVQPQSCQPYEVENYVDGVREGELDKSSTIGGSKTQRIVGLIGLLLVSLTLPWLAEIFAMSKDAFDPDFQQMIVDIHRWEMLGYITLGINSATVALLLGYGYSRLTMLLNVARVFLFRVPVLWCFQRWTTLGPEAVGLTMMVSNVLTGLSAIVIAIPVVRRIRRLAREREGTDVKAS